jgi:hypothetical protein
MSEQQVDLSSKQQTDQWKANAAAVLAPIAAWFAYGIYLAYRAYFVIARTADGKIVDGLGRELYKVPMIPVLYSLYPNGLWPGIVTHLIDWLISFVWIFVVPSAYVAVLVRLQGPAADSIDATDPSAGAGNGQ